MRTSAKRILLASLALPALAALSLVRMAPGQLRMGPGPVRAAPLATNPTTEPSGLSPTTAPSEVATTAPTTLPTTGPANALINALSSPDPHERRHAAEDLLKLGESARPLLENLLKQTSDLDVITRAQATLAQLDENRMIGPSYVTLHFKDAPARAVAEALGQQAFAPLRVFPDNLWDDQSIPKVTIDVDHQPFWTAMRQFSEQTGFDLNPYVDGLRLMRGLGRSSGIAVVHGPFLIVASQISRTQTVQLGPRGSSHSEFSLQMTAFPEPKIVIMQGGSVLEIKEAVDDAGNSLVSGAAERRMFAMGNSGAWQLFARLSWPQHPGKKIARFVCSTTFTLQTKSQKLEIPDILTAKEKTQNVGGSEVSFKGISKIGENWELKLSANNAAPIQELMQNQNRLRLLDADGHPLDRRGMSAQNDGNRMTWKLLFGAARRANGAPGGDPSRLVWDVPLESKAVPVQFEFKDLPMPD